MRGSARTNHQRQRHPRTRARGSHSYSSSALDGQTISLKTAPRDPLACLHPIRQAFDGPATDACPSAYPGNVRASGGAAERRSLSGSTVFSSVISARTCSMGPRSCFPTYENRLYVQGGGRGRRARGGRARAEGEGMRAQLHILGKWL